MRRLAVSMIILLGIAWVYSITVTALYASCTEDWAQIGQEFSIAKLRKSYDISPTRQQSVTFSGRTGFGQNKGKLREIQKKDGLPWRSLHSTAGYAYQGDPRNFVMIFGRRVAHFFGFRYLDDLTMTIPDAVEMTRAIQIINNRLRELGEPEISITFYESDSIMDNLEHAIEYSRNRRLPLATNDNEALHDISYHAASILIPPQILERHGNFITRAIDFINFLQTRIGSDLSLAWLNNLDGLNTSFTDLLVSLISRDIDQATANFKILTNQINDYEEIFEYLYEPLTKGGIAIDTYLRNDINQLFSSTRMAHNHPERVEQLLQLFDEFTAANQENRFTSQLSLSGQEVPANGFQSINQNELDAFLRELNRRRAAIAHAVATLN